jgi:hypothetical protein
MLSLVRSVNINAFRTALGTFAHVQRATDVQHLQEIFVLETSGIPLTAEIIIDTIPLWTLRKHAFTKRIASRLGMERQ